MLAGVLGSFCGRPVDDKAVEPVLVQLGDGLLLHCRSRSILCGQHIVVVIAVVAVVTVSIAVSVTVPVSSVEVVVLGGVCKVLVIFTHFLLVLIRCGDDFIDHHQQPDVVAAGGNRIIRRG